MKKLIALIAFTALFIVSCKNESFYIITTKVEPEGSGSIIVSPSSSRVHEGTSVSFLANPNEGYVFSCWGGKLYGTNNPITIQATSDIIVSAHFAKDIKPFLPGLDGYSLVFNDEFEGTELDISQWSTALAYGKPNNDLRYSSESKYLYVADGSLHISTIQNPGESIPTSSIIISKEAWTKGYFEARVKIPSGKGTWPAFWLAPFAADWPLSGEIDILEAVGFNPDYTHHVVWCSKYRNNEYMVDYYLPSAQNNYHVYAAEVTDSYVKIYVDNVNVLTYLNDGANDLNTWPYSHFAQKVIIDLCWGGEWAGSQGLDFSCLPATLEVDYVRVFQK